MLAGEGQVDGRALSVSLAHLGHAPCPRVCAALMSGDEQHRWVIHKDLRSRLPQISAQDSAYVVLQMLCQMSSSRGVHKSTCMQLLL